MKRRTLLSSAMLALAVSLVFPWQVRAASAGAAANFPSKPISFIVPFPAGNVSDTMVRIVSEELTKILGQPIVVENRVGGSGSIGLAAAARAPADGYTWVIGTGGALITAPLMQKSPAFDPLKDFAPITMMAPLPMIIVARPDLPANTLGELLALARKNPGKYDYASLGAGSLPHLAGELLSSQAGVDMLHVPYKGSSQALTDLLGGRVAVMFDTVPPAMAQIRAGKLKPLAITSAKPTDVAPGIPPVAATPGMEGYEAISWTGLLAPAGTPPAIVQKVHDAVAQVLAMPAIKKRFLDMGLELQNSSPRDFRNLIASEHQKWAKIIKQAGVMLQ
ncbi:MAG: tripartite tricarboxylate transporter substrate binding protein [Burkholderiaceae bacterium]